MRQAAHLFLSENPNRKVGIIVETACAMEFNWTCAYLATIFSHLAIGTLTSDIGLSKTVI